MIRRAIAFLEQQRLQIALTALMVFIIGGFQVTKLWTARNTIAKRASISSITR